jgi:Na+/H+-translocating membrane pyrophosphatase
MRLSVADLGFRRSGLLKTYFGVSALVTCFVAWLFVPDAAWAVMFVAMVCNGGLFFAVAEAGTLLAAADGTDSMKRVSEPIREGSEGFIRTQYGFISRMALGVGVLLFATYCFRSDAGQAHGGPSVVSIAIITTASFFAGAACSAFAGYIGLWLSVRANLRVAAAAARADYCGALMLAMKGGAICGTIVVGLCISGLSTLFVLLHACMGRGASVTARVPHLLVGYSFGASFVALFAQLGGGIYTKAADVGADMVGKVESDIPEDDPRNPATIADLVGDNVGDCAGRGADLFESITGEIIGAMILGGAMAQEAELENGINLVMFPLVLHALDLVISSVGVASLRVRAAPPIPSTPLFQAQQRSAEDFAEGGTSTKDAASVLSVEDPLATLERGYGITIGLAFVVMTALSRLLLHTEQYPNAWMSYCACGYVGIATSYLFLLFTKMYTDYNYHPVQRIAHASLTGHGTNVIAGLAVGLESTCFPTLTCGAALLISFWLGQGTGLASKSGRLVGGLYGTAIATMGMLSTAVYILAMDTFGPITDNAGGIVEMSQQSEVARLITDRLDAVGNVTKATTKGYSIGAAALASFLLLRAFLDVAEELSGETIRSVDFAVPEVFVAGLFGGMLIFVFAGLAMSAVGRSAAEVVHEVRRQFDERPGIMDYTEKPDYARCVSIVTKSALREMIRPGLLAVLAPISIGVTFRVVGSFTGQPLLGIVAVAGFLLFSTATGILMALFLNNSGGAFDNAKKYIETGAHGGKRSFAHQSAVTGDTLGDPCKDTAGPSIHVLIKLLSTIALVMCPLFLG